MSGVSILVLPSASGCGASPCRRSGDEQRDRRYDKTSSRLVARLLPPLAAYTNNPTVPVLAQVAIRLVLDKTRWLSPVTGGP